MKRLVVDVLPGEYTIARMPAGTAPPAALFELAWSALVSVTCTPDEISVVCPSDLAPAAAVAQKVVLYDEDPNDPQGKRYVGSALWRTETVSPGPGLAPELAVRADIEIPERKLRMTWSLRRNSDKALPAWREWPPHWGVRCMN